MSSKFLSLPVNVDFTVTSLCGAIKLIKSEVERKEFDPRLRLIISSTYNHHTILEVIFTSRSRLDIPFEVSYALPSDAWMLIVEDEDIIFYNPGKDTYSW